jgi:nucleotide-binding universal stress UspA family protein
MLVHAAPDYWAAVAGPELGLDHGLLDRGAIDNAREMIGASLRTQVPEEMIARLEVVVGRAPAVLADVAARERADLLVMGGKHHRGLERIAGSAIVHMVRAHDIPVLATDGGGSEIRRVLAAVDLSYAAQPVIAAAEAWAGMFNARLRVLNVVEPVPVVPGVTLHVGDEECYRAAEQLLELQVWPLITNPATETVIRRGRAAAAIAEEASQWHADLLILGSHGKGWVNRLLIGSTSERLLHVLPVTTLVIPVGDPGSHAALSAVSHQPWEQRPVAPATLGT